ncbi:PREDICTED: translocon-associated protein subunit delta [Bison bison bison]|uniref:Translocon-associated protein subunit delta n=1 Tax=Bison bison bison TaxID=43346 RepID=A0A6P3IT68_BISBB|nr:PREDICTED: translocon-associated protein subunit delta [Bison bison bison]
MVTVCRPPYFADGGWKGGGGGRPSVPFLPRVLTQWASQLGALGSGVGWSLLPCNSVSESQALSLPLCLLPAAEACVEPQITPSYYTTSDAVISTETVFIVEISLTCKNRVQNMALYADVSGKQFPVTRGQDVGRYQVSWSLDHKSAHAGTYEVRFFDEESYSLLRKAQRNNEDVSVIPPLFTVSVDHRGTWNGPWVSTEVLAAAIGLVIYYLAFSAKSHIQA